MERMCLRRWGVKKKKREKKANGTGQDRHSRCERTGKARQKWLRRKSGESAKQTFRWKVKRSNHIWDGVNRATRAKNKEKNEERANEDKLSVGRWASLRWPKRCLCDSVGLECEHEVAVVQWRTETDWRLGGKAVHDRPRLKRLMWIWRKKCERKNMKTERFECGR